MEKQKVCELTMKKLQLIIGFILLLNTLQAQTNQQYSFKLQGLYGNILNHDPKYVGPLIKGPVTGAEFSVEFQTMGEKPWHQFQNFPNIGIGSVWLSLGNPEKLGNAFAIYPYISFPIIRTKGFNLNIKAGAGLSYLTKTYYNTNTDSTGAVLPSLTGTNAAIGSNLNVYFSGGGSMEIPIANGISFSAEYTWNHMSNGSVVAPNTGLNLLNGFIGLKYSPNYKNFKTPEKRALSDISKRLTTEIIVSGGVRQLYYKDNRYFPIGSISIAEFYPITNFYRMGLGVDAFYDGVFGEVNSSSIATENVTKYTRTYVTSNLLSNKFRAGISWQHELMMGKLTAGFHFGLYLYNPIKNLEPYEDAKTKALNKPLIYSYNIDKEDGWLYTRASIKYAITEHIFASIGLKTHLQKAEFIEWGLGYRL